MNIEFTEQKTDPKNNKNAIDFRWSDIRREDKKTLLRLTLMRAYKIKLIKIFIKKVTRGLFDYCGIVPKEKKYI